MTKTAKKNKEQELVVTISGKWREGGSFTAPLGSYLRKGPAGEGNPALDWWTTPTAAVKEEAVRGKTRGCAAARHTSSSSGFHTLTLIPIESKVHRV